MRKSFSVLTLLVLFVLAVPFVSAQGTDGNQRAEIRYMEGMIDHHQMAVDMAQDCLAKAGTQEVRDLCQNIITAQSAEILQLRSWLLSWYGIAYDPMPMMQDCSMMQGGMMGNMPMQGTAMPQGGMMHEGMMTADPPMMMGHMAGLHALTGTDYEIAWLEAMSDHHDDAIHMSERLMPKVQHEELGTFAQGVIDAQSAEIEMMQTLLTTLQGGS